MRFLRSLEWHEWVVLLAALLMLLVFAPIHGSAETAEVPFGYVLGPGDEIRVSVVDLDDVGKYPVRIDLRGTIDLPIAGRLDAVGMTAEELEAKIAERLSSYLQSPDVTVSIRSGKPRREFLHVDDIADAALHLMETYNEGEIVNVGVGKDISIAELAKLIAETVGYTGELTFDSSKPDGMPRKLLDVSRLKGLGWSAKIGLRAGVTSTYKVETPGLDD